MGKIAIVFFVFGSLLIVVQVYCSILANSPEINDCSLQSQLAPFSVNPEEEAAKFSDIGDIILQSRIQKANLPDDLLVCCFLFFFFLLT